MGTSHGIAAGFGSVFSAAVLVILTKQFGMDSALASAWLIVVGTLLAAPGAGVMAWLMVKAKADPALTAALRAAQDRVAELEASVGTESQPQLQPQPSPPRAT